MRRTGLPLERERERTRRLADTLLRCHAGQALDLAVVVDALPTREVRQVVGASTALKTGGLVELSLSLPAAARGSRGAVPALARCGRVLGTALQMLDDLGNLAGQRAPRKFGEDLRHGRPTWPWVWPAEDVERFEAFRPRALAARASSSLSTSWRETCFGARCVEEDQDGGGRSSHPRGAKLAYPGDARRGLAGRAR